MALIYVVKRSDLRAIMEMEFGRFYESWTFAISFESMNMK